MRPPPPTVWLRRGTGPVAALVLTLFSAVVTMTQRQWMGEADWGLRHLAAAAYIIAPLLAAACANDVARKAIPTLAVLSRASSRRSRLWSTLVVSVWSWALLAAGLAAVVVTVIVAAHDGIAARDLWLAPEIASIFLAAVMIGLVVGRSVSGVLAPVLAAVVVFASANVLGPLGVPLFTTGVASGSLVGLQRDPTSAALGIALHLALALGCAAGSWWWSGARPVRRSRSKLVAIAMTVAATGIATATMSNANQFVPTTETYVCLGSQPQLCGPQSATKAMLAAQRSLAAATATLGGRGLELTSKVIVLRGPAVQQRAGEGTPFALDPARITADGLPTRDTVEVLAAPRACAALFRDTGFEPYLADIETVRTWMTSVLDTDGAASQTATRLPAPHEVSSAYQRLSSCPIA